MPITNKITIGGSVGGTFITDDGFGSVIISPTFSDTQNIPKEALKKYKITETKEEYDKRIRQNLMEDGKYYTAVDETKKRMITDAEFVHTPGLWDDFKNTPTYSAGDFAAVDFIMGLPPKYTLGGSISGLDFDVEEQMISNFPILKITPMNFMIKNSDGQKNKMQKIERLYQFAVTPENTITYSHSNEYKPSAITDELKTLMSYSTVNDIRQLGHTMGGPLGDTMHYAGQWANIEVHRLIESIQYGINNSETLKNNPLLQRLGNVGNDVLRGMLLGARADFPNIWQNSATGMNWSFTIELRTYATDPESEDYQRDIVTPLNALLSLSLPKAGDIMAYTEPPYIQASIDNVFNVKLGGITSINWNIPMNTLNMKGVPRHIQIQLTISDLYNVMLQGKDITQKNAEIPTKEKFLEHLTKKPTKKVGNEQVWKNEYGNVKLGGVFDEQTKTKIPTNLPIQQNIQNPQNSLKIKVPNINLNDFFKKIIDGNPVMEYLKNNKLQFNLPSLNDLPIFKLPITDIIGGNIDIEKLLKGQLLESDFIKNLFKLDIVGVDTDPFGQALTKFGTNLYNNLIGGLYSGSTNLFTGDNLKRITNNLFDIVPTQLLTGISNASTKAITNILASQETNELDFLQPLNIVSNTIRSIPTQISNMIQKEYINEVDYLNGTIANISKYDPKLDNYIRISKPLQETLAQTIDIFTKELNKKEEDINIIEETKTIHQNIKDKLNSVHVVVPEYIEGMQKICDAVSTVTDFKTLETLLSENMNRTNSSKCVLRVESI